MADPKVEIVVFVTTSSEEEAARIGRALVEAGLAACANVLPRVRSIFSWEGKVSEEQESLMVLKTRADLFEDLAGLTEVAKGVMQLAPEPEGRVGIEPIRDGSCHLVW